MDQINKISKMCDAKVNFTWPGFSEAADGGRCSKQKKAKGKKKGKEKKKKEESESEKEEERGEKPPHEDKKDAQDEEGEEVKKKRKLECEACTRAPAARRAARRAALWCCTRCVLMFCGAMRMFVAAAGVLGLCLTMFFIFAPGADRKH